MEDSQDVEVELYEEIINNTSYVSPRMVSPCSLEEVSDPLPSQDPMELLDNTVISFTPTWRPALRPELAMDNQESQRVSVTHVDDHGGPVEDNVEDHGSPVEDHA